MWKIWIFSRNNQLFKLPRSHFRAQKQEKWTAKADLQSMINCISMVWEGKNKKMAARIKALWLKNGTRFWGMKVITRGLKIRAFHHLDLEQDQQVTWESANHHQPESSRTIGLTSIWKYYWQNKLGKTIQINKISMIENNLLVKRVEKAWVEMKVLNLG